MTSPLQKILTGLLAALALLLAPAMSLAAQPKNYWLVSSTGQVFAYGKAKTHGSEYRKRFKGKVTGIKGTANGGGYWIVTSKTHYGFGDASRYKYKAGGLKKYTGKLKPKGLKGKIVGYAIATIPIKKRGGGGAPTGTTTTTRAAERRLLTHLDSDQQPQLRHRDRSVQPNVDRRRNQRRELVMDDQVRQPPQRADRSRTPARSRAPPRRAPPAHRAPSPCRRPTASARAARRPGASRSRSASRQ